MIEAMSPQEIRANTAKVLDTANEFIQLARRVGDPTIVLAALTMFVDHLDTQIPQLRAFVILTLQDLLKHLTAKGN